MTNSTASQTMPGAASSTQKSLLGWNGLGLRRRALPDAALGAVAGGSGGAWIVILDPLARDEPRLLPERVGVDGKLQLTEPVAEVRRHYRGRHQARRQDLLFH